MNDPQMKRVCTMRRSEIYLDTDHVDPDDPRTARYLDWQEAIVGSRHHITSSVVLTEGLEAGVSLHLNREQGAGFMETQQQIAQLFSNSPAH